MLQLFSSTVLVALTSKTLIFLSRYKHTRDPLLTVLDWHSNIFAVMRNSFFFFLFKIKKINLIYSYADLHNEIPKRTHDEVWQDIDLIAQVWTAEKARKNTVVTGLFHLNTIYIYTKTLLLIGQSPQLHNPWELILNVKTMNLEHKTWLCSILFRSRTDFNV